MAHLALSLNLSRGAYRPGDSVTATLEARQLRHCLYDTCLCAVLEENVLVVVLGRRTTSSGSTLTVESF